MSLSCHRRSSGNLVIREMLGRYETHGRLSEADVLEAASDILLERCRRHGILQSPSTVKQYLQARLGGLESEQFDVLWLDNQHGLIAVETLSTGTIDGASVYPREVVKAALRHNAKAAVFSHNHPSGVAEPSAADRSLTERLRQALAVIDVRVLDHVVVSGTGCVAFSERGWL
ncbi:MAG: JAB domain-containing protein [Pseudomonadota bacterium]|nr:JAB domain-containing protein [Pseudomonadota bacterium]